MPVCLDAQPSGNPLYNPLGETDDTRVRFRGINSFAGASVSTNEFTLPEP
jgi:hypothetical protein